MEPRIAVIIPAFNEDDVIEDCLQSLVAQTYSNFEAIIVDDASTDGTKEKILRYASENPQRIRLKEFGKVGPGRARNLVVHEVDAEIVAFMDADCIATANWLEQLIKGFQAGPNVGSTGGPHLAPAQSNSFQSRVEAFLKHLSPGIDFYKNQNCDEIIDVPHNPLCNVAYRRELFNDLKGFREDLWPGEDVEIDQRVLKSGFRITYNPKALVYHHRPENIEQWLKVMHAYGRSQGKMVREDGFTRKLHYLAALAIGLLSISIWQLCFWFQLPGAFAGLILLYAFLYFRPKWNNSVGIFFSSFQWFNGFWEGWITKRSDPPGKRPSDSQE